MKTTAFGTIILSLLLSIVLTSSVAQAQRLHDDNTISWASSQNTIHVSKRVSLALEYQWRREGIFNSWQQSLARGGIQYHFKSGVTVLGGYAYVITYPFGDYPAGPHPVPEHRFFEQVAWNDTKGRFILSHRIRLEQRLLGKIDQKSADGDVKDWVYLNRIRYQMRLAYPLNHKTMTDKTWYMAAYDELFIGFGSNVNQNIFDQNRIGVLAGYQLNKMFRIEGGYLNQTVQQGALVGSKQVYQYNNGLVLNVYLTKPVKEKKAVEASK